MRMTFFKFLVLSALISPAVASAIKTVKVITPLDQIKDLNKKLASVKTFRARFTIVKDRTVYTGDMEFWAPDRFRMDFDNPKKQVMLADGKNLWIYLPTLSVAVKQKLTRIRKEETETGLITGLNLERLIREYNVSFAKGHNPPKIYKYLLTPKDTTAGFKKILVSILPNGLVSKAEATTPLGKKVVISLAYTAINPKINPDDFTFEVPADCQVLNNILFPMEQ